MLNMSTTTEHNDQQTHDRWWRLTELALSFGRDSVRPIFETGMIQKTTQQRLVSLVRTPGDGNCLIWYFLFRTCACSTSFRLC